MRMELVVRQHHATQIFTVVMYAFVREMKLAGLRYVNETNTHVLEIVNCDILKYHVIWVANLMSSQRLKIITGKIC